MCQVNIPRTITQSPPPPAYTVVTRHVKSMFSFCLRQILTYHLNVSTGIEIHQTRQHISSYNWKSLKSPFFPILTFSLEFRRLP